jgi:hypothetical protein
MKNVATLGRPVIGLCFALGTALYGQMTDVLTYHNDNSRTGQQLHEEVLSTSNVNTSHFGLLRVLTVDGKVDAEPLYAAGVKIPGAGLRNALFVATEHDSVYAFNADGTNVFWHVSMLEAGETTSDDRGCSQVTPEIGITATPVIDRKAGSNGVIFVVAMSKKGSTYYQRIHALDLTTGAALLAPKVVSAAFPGTGDNAVGTNVVFDPKQYKERCGLLLLNGVIYTAWASHCDIRPYTGWIMGYDEQTLAQTSVLNVTPNGNEGAFWNSGAGLAADAQGNIYALDGNGTFDATLTTSGFPTNGDFGNSFLKFSTAGNSLAVADYFCMSNQASENGSDEDLGSGGALLLPDMVDASNNARQLAVGAGKDSNIYIVDRNDMGQFDPTTNAIWQQLTGAAAGGVYGMPAYFNGFLYYCGQGDALTAYPFENALAQTVGISQSAETFVYPGATPGVSANGTAAGIVWATENTSPAVLNAYNATNLAEELYNSDQAGSRDHFGDGNKFITPMIASARVYVGTTTGVGVFGLLDSSTLTPLQAWRNTNFGNPSNVGAGANGASPAGDGIPNLIKYALGLNPLAVAAAGQLPLASLRESDGNVYLTLTANRAAIAPDVTYLAQVSGDLINWVSGGTNTVTLTNVPTQLVVRDNVPASAAGQRYIRLSVSSP